ncbi:hypothetical protein N7468_007672 [Penicillium chermesinum]|uniref:Acid phosphatase n=1 Tax=Penicillium chermesinum TaxID=63820 RepID=A0A9W9NUT8_9EURO|nr:uncharacterized protein N7468_007672 [Penicillium chermesinum]KAJ5226447.1 hypothetical protein N7468_007672 [Penicillium chermesinum]
MTTLIPREPYSQEELNQLYPKGLKLQLVQVFLRHGERTPVNARFQNVRPPLLSYLPLVADLPLKTGLHPYWPYCAAAKHMVQIAASKQDLTEWNGFQWRRRVEAFGRNDESIAAKGPAGEVEGICGHGELTDKGRETTYALGQRLRHLYVDQLGFMPKIKENADDMYLRATPIPRALESMQQAFWGMYPASARTQDFPPPVIVGRSSAAETLFPNEANCRRFRQLARLFADRAAVRWNDSEQMDYLNKLWSKYMPANSPKVAVDGHPRLSGIMDTINATDAHGPATKLPSEFYDKKGRAVIDRIAVEEWFAGYNESHEYRKLGIGSLMGDVVDRMVSTALGSGWRSEAAAPEAGNKDSGKAIKFALSGCHDTTLAAILSSLGSFENESWPPFTSSVAIELFSQAPIPSSDAGDTLEEFSNPKVATKKRGVFASLFGGDKAPSKRLPDSEIERAPISSLPEEARKSLRKHYVRIRYNDRPVLIPGCAATPGNHLPGTRLSHWAAECMENLDEGLFGPGDQERVPAGN